MDFANEDFFLLTENQQKILEEVAENVTKLNGSLWNIPECTLNAQPIKPLFWCEFDMHEIPFNIPIPQFNFDEMKVKLTIIQEILNTSIEQVKKGRKALKKIMHTYPEWKKLRDDSIKSLREITKSLEIEKNKWLQQTLVGTTIGASLLLTGNWLADKRIAPLLSLTGVASTAIGFSGYYETQIMNEGKMKQVQSILEKNKKYFKELYNLQEHARKLENALSEFLQMDIVLDMFESVKDFVIKLVETKNDDRRINYIKEELEEVVINNHFLSRTKKQAVPKSIILVIISCLVLIILLMLKRENQIVFAFLPQFMKNMSPFIPDSITMSATYLHAADASLISMNIEKDSNSQKISEAVKKLEKEAENFEKFYENMNKNSVKII